MLGGSYHAEALLISAFPTEYACLFSLSGDNAPHVILTVLRKYHQPAGELPEPQQNCVVA